MRIMLKARMSTQRANNLARDGMLSRTIEGILSELKPEAAYFTDDQGARTAYIFLDIKDSSEIPRIAEPWFLALDSEIELHPVMNPGDLSKAQIEQVSKRY